MIINREDLLKQLESVLPGLSTREVIDQSSCLVFQDKRVYTYNDEIACSQKSLLKIEGAVPAMPFISILRKLREDELEIVLDRNGGNTILLIKGKRRRAGINMEQRILLPVDAVEKPKKWKKLPPNFSDGIATIQDCAGTSDTEFVLTCINITSEWMEASNRFQAIRYSMKTNVSKPLLIRRDSLRHLSLLDMTEFSETRHWAHFRNSDGLTLSCRYWMDKYPSDDISKVLRVKGKSMVLPKGLKNAVEKAEVFSSENTESSDVIVKIKKGKIRITGRGISGWFTEIKKSKYSGVDLQFTIPPKLLMKIVQQHNECEVTKRCLKAVGEKFVYVTVLGEVER